jgi:pimeloyl-ACP methyl ester carboxylesterase
MLGSAPSIATLARWLGPWADAASAPNVAIEEASVDEIRVRLYRPRRTPRATFLIAPGLHYAGPDDVRMDRFCRILAASGHLVVAPFIPSYLALMPDARAIADFERVFRALPRWSAQKPVVFSISFGSLLAFALAAKYGDALAGLVIFGGYATFQGTLEFCLTGTVPSGRAAVRDPLNQPVVLMNLLAQLEPPCSDHAAISAAWRAYVERTWGRPEMKARERFTEVAASVAVPPHVRALFDIGVGVTPGAAALALDALTRFDGRALDPTPYLAKVTGRVDLVHGTDDDVIPFEHSHELAAQLVNADVRTHITGLYGHTGAQTPKLSALAKELVTMIRVLRAFAR